MEGHERGGFGGLEEGRLADLALDVAGLLVLFGAVSMRDTDEERPKDEELTTLSCDLATLPSFWLRSRFC